MLLILKSCSAAQPRGALFSNPVPAKARETQGPLTERKQEGGEKQEGGKKKQTETERVGNKNQKRGQKKSQIERVKKRAKKKRERKHNAE